MTPKPKRKWPDPRVQVAARGIRSALGGLSVVLLGIGVMELILGVLVNHFSQDFHQQSPTGLPLLWTLGFPSIITGTAGLYAVYKGKRTWINLWWVFSVCVSAGGFGVYVCTGILEPAMYGVHLHVFGHCTEQAGVCMCRWEKQDKVSSLSHAPCANIRLVTQMYLALVFLYVLSIAITVIASVLSCVLTACLRFCVPKEDSRKQMNSAIYGCEFKQNARDILANTQYVLLHGRVRGAGEVSPYHTPVTTPGAEGSGQDDLGRQELVYTDSERMELMTKGKHVSIKEETETTDSLL